MIISDRVDVRRVSPSRFMPKGVRMDCVDKFTRDYFLNFHSYFVDKDTDDYNLNRLESCVMVVAPILLSTGLPLHDFSALEIGCGSGMKAFPVASLFKRYIGVDLDRYAIECGSRIAGELEIRNLHFFCMNAIDVVTNPQNYGLDGGIDILFLHAVMEHLTLDERVAIFELIRQVRSAGGSIILLETPNRLFPFDHHSSHLHFVNSLPDSVALRYIRKKTTRQAAQDFTAEDLRSTGEGSGALLSEKNPITRLYRLGRGLSYHDFELDYYEDPESFAPAADGYHPCLLNHQPLARCELQVNDYFRDNDMRVHRVFSRAWIDFFDLPGVPQKCSPRAVFLSPTCQGECRVTHRHEFWSLDTFQCFGSGRLVFDIEQQRTEIILLLEQFGHAEAVTVRADDSVIEVIALSDLEAARPKTWHRHFAVPVQIPRGCRQISVMSPPNSCAFLHGALLS
jgi:2-polyprenyl-3-methyl-5-hydroxy-6-metoxy-1,4-benzoquinol methylase